MTNAIYIAHTVERSKLDVRFSILCLIHHSRSIKEQLRIIVVSDHPEWFEDLPVLVEKIDGATIKKWKGEFEFLHRLKIEAIKYVRDKYDGDLLYMDGDTCFFEDAAPVIEKIASGKSLMHEFEGKLESRSNLTLKRTHDFFLKNPKIDVASSAIQVNPEQSLYNAGVIGISNSDAHLLEQILEFNDALYPIYRNHVTEQLMFSYVLSQNTRISTCDEQIYHWWGRAQQAGQMLALFFEENKANDVATMAINAHQFVDTLKTAEKDRMTFFQNLGRSLEKRKKRLNMFLKR